MNKQLKNAALTALRSTGLFRKFLNSPRRGERLLILCYHGISAQDEHEWSPYLYVTAKHFRDRMLLLREYGLNVLPLGEAPDRLRAGTLPPRSAAITFDDGFVDFHEVAAPILRELGLPCTLYLTTHYCNYRLPVFNLAIDYAIWKAGLKTFPLDDFGYAGELPTATVDERAAAIRHIIAWCDRKGLDTAGKDELARQIAAQLGVDYQVLVTNKMFQIMTPEAGTKLSAEGFDIQLHTHRHRTPDDRDLFIREIVDNRRRIQELTGKTPVHFCYPSGVHKMQFLPWLKECGVESATTCELGLASKQADSLLLRRVLDDSTVSRLDFESWLCGVRV